jgi:PAS domain S-box-containing protein
VSQLHAPIGNPGAIQRRFVVLALLALLPLTLLLGYLGWREYDQQLSNVLSAREASVKARQLELEGLVAVTRSEVTMLASALSADLEVSWSETPRLGSFDAVTGDGVLALNRRPDPGLGDRHGTILGIPNAISARASGRIELAGVERLFPVQAATHTGDSTLRWTYFLSSSRDLAAIYPWVPDETLLGAPTGRKAAFARLFEGDLFRLYSDETRSSRAPFWTPMQLDLARDFRVVTFAAPVEARGIRRGLVAADLIATELARVLIAEETPGTAVSVIDQHGDVLVTSSLSLAAEGLAFLSRDLTARLTPRFRGVIDGQNISVTSVEGTPWRIIAMTPNSEIQSRALRAVIPYALSLAGVFTTLAIVFLILQHQLIRPAARLANYIAAEARGQTRAPPSVPPAWRMLSDKVSAAAKDRKAHVHQLRAMIDGIPLRAVYIDHAYIYRDANKEFLDFVGMSLEDLAGKTVSDVLGPNVQLEYTRLAPQIRRGEVARFEGWIEYYGRGARFLQVSILPFKALDEDEAGFLTFTRDLTELKQAEQDSVRNVEALAASEALHRAVVTSALDGIIVVDDKGITLEFNPSAEAMFGYTAQEAIGRSIGDLIVPKVTRTAHTNGMNRYLATGVPHVIGRRVEVEGMRKDGSLIPVELTVTEVGASERRIFTSHLRDLTDSRAKKKELDEQRDKLHQAEKMTAMGSLLAGVAHELNNPLAVVVAQSTLLEETADSPATKKRAERIHAAADRCGRIVKTFLAMARQQAPSRATVDLSRVVESALAITIYGLRTSGVLVETHFAPDTPAVEADTDQLSQVVSNLLINAQQAMMGMDPPRLLRIETGRTAGAKAFIRISDNGPGVPEHLRERIFDAFFTTKPVGVGTGIGLSVSSNIIRAHGGTLSLGNAPDGGASFLIELPASTPSFPVRPEAGTLPILSGQAILVVDDEPDVGATLAEILERMGAETELALSRSEAAEHLARRTFDLIMTDLRMPDGGGVELHKELAAAGNPHADRMIFVTGDTVAGPALLSASVKIEALLMLEKPFSPADVTAVVKAALKRAADAPPA